MIRWLGRDDEGAFAVLFAILLVVIVGFSALAVDVGYWYASKRQLQTAADAAALAGCGDLARDRSNATIWATVEDYAGRNFTRPLELPDCSVVPPSAGGLSDIGPNYVKVTVESDSPAFLSRVLGQSRVRIRAQSIARIGYITGAKSPCPWGVPLLQATHVFASAGGGPESVLATISAGVWRGYLTTSSVGPVLIRAFNDQTLDPNYPSGVPEEAQGAGYVVSIPSGSPFVAVSAARLSTSTEFPGSVMYTSGDGEKIVVYVTVAQPLLSGESLSVAFGNQNYAMSLVPATTTYYRAQFDAPTTTSVTQAFTYDVELRQGGKVLNALTPAGGFIVRRSTFPIGDVVVQPSALTSTITGPVQVTVRMNDYEYGKRYELKVTGGGAEIGNFMAIDFSTLRHSPYWTKQDPAEYPAMPTGTSFNYYPYIAGNPAFDFVMHIGDAVWTATGNLSGPQTRDALITRFGGEAADFAAWDAAGKPDSKRLILVPVVEKIQPVTGQTPLRVINFATFYVEAINEHGGDVSVAGRFVEYTDASLDVVEDPPPGPFAVQAVHLSAIGLDF